MEEILNEFEANFVNIVLSKKAKIWMAQRLSEFEQKIREEVLNKRFDDNYDDFLHYYYKQKCSGCGHHNSMWATIIESPQWKEWKKVGQYDFSECEELGIMSEGHFQAFLKYLKEEFLKKIW